MNECGTWSLCTVLCPVYVIVFSFIVGYSHSNAINSWKITVQQRIANGEWSRASLTLTSKCRHNTHTHTQTKTIVKHIGKWIPLKGIFILFHIYINKIIAVKRKNKRYKTSIKQRSNMCLAWPCHAYSIINIKYLRVSTSILRTYHTLDAAQKKTVSRLFCNNSNKICILFTFEWLA